MKKGYLFLTAVIILELLIIAVAIPKENGGGNARLDRILYDRNQDLGAGEDHIWGEETEMVFSEVKKETIEEEAPKVRQEKIQEEPMIRIRITVSDFSSEYHEEVIVSSEQTLILSCSEKQQIYTGGQTVRIRSDHIFFQEGSIMVTSPDGMLYLESVAHRDMVHSYPGSLELFLTAQGIVVINELRMEEYVERVVPSEMPAYYGLNAALIQAVCSRTFAYKKMLDETIDPFGAVMNDSTDYQVYNAAPIQEVSSEAVRQTCGLILTWQGEPFIPYYFSTSCGYNTTNAVWSSQPLPFLRTQNLTYRGEIDFQSENAFRDFILNWEYPAYERQCTWFRWNYHITIEELRKMTAERIVSLSERYPGSITQMAMDGNPCEFDPSILLELQKIEVAERFSGGMAKKVILYCSGGMICVQKEMVIRKLFGSPSRLYSNHAEEGSSVSEGDYLPSAFFFPEPEEEEGKVTAYTFCGGGNGHGIGLSQNAAYELLKMGITWKEVLQFFYLGTGFAEMY